ncbi:MAG: HAMP domain-containing sensor histidine kinase [Atopobium minutum]|uniref:sensor histidine kinase n=1 Tax=Atopobium minutum TaxID=1381 RepID=UPI00290B3FE3|nr:HAMP domain-containing sensor histidine kinase [Atopobium minutum]MDU5357476.1 HAMP domain-containing sensor histidine kinase [Atopobium minutum]MDU5892857.1 HAMP domain-containing sensor histidine kinase [Atopobium minutum]
MANFVIGKRTRQQNMGESFSDSTKAAWKTTRHGQATRDTFGTRLTLGFSAMAIMSVIVLLVVLGIVWEAQFQRYTRANMERVAAATANVLAQEYEAAGDVWTHDVLASVGTTVGYSTDVGVQVLNRDGLIIYLSDKVGRASSSVPALNSKDGNSVVSADIITSNNVKVGEVRIWVNGSDTFLTKNDADFRTNSYMAIGLAAVIAVLIASVIGYLISRGFAEPIRRITSTARLIRNGELFARSGLTGKDEIGQLGETFDDMANSLEKDLQLERRLTNDVAHELRTPLMAMLATVEAMQDGVLPRDDERLETLASETRRLSRLVSAMLTLSRMENGTAKMNPTKTELVGLVRGIVSSQEQLFADKELRLRFVTEVPKEEVYAEVDRDMINQAVINFMSNALRYTPEGGWVVVEVGQDRNDVWISVSDTGIGIAKEDLSRIFSRFWRSDASRERVSGGLGVGMAVTKEIVDRHHGYISVESELGKGTTFTLHLPREYRPSELSSATIDE